MANLHELVSAYNAKLTEVNGIYEKQGDAAPDEDTRAHVKALNLAISELDKQIADTKAWQDEAARAKTAAAKHATPVLPAPFAGAPTADPRALLASAGARVLDDPAFKAWLGQINYAPGAVSREQFKSSPRVSFEGVGVKTLITGASDTSGGAFVITDRKPFVDLPFRPFLIRDIITIGQTNSDTVDYPYLVSRTNAAAPVVEATSTAGSVGVKPESDLVLGVGSAPVKTVAHWIPASRRSLADAPMIRTLIDTLLRDGLTEEWEDQVVAGDGTGENITGLLHYSGIQTQAYTTNLITTTRTARTKVRTGAAKATPTAWLMHPNDWEDFDLLADNEQRYYYGGPSAMGTPRLWGLPVVESEAMTEGTAMVGDFRQVVWWDREQMQILMSDSHSDFFIRNLVAFLAELRGALTVWNAAALVSVDLTP